MHFSIPETEDLVDSSGKTFVGYRLHLNGVHYCTVRYRQLRHLYLQMSEEFGLSNSNETSSIPSFPSRSLLSLSVAQSEERRQLLEKFIQSISQDARIMNSPLFRSFLQFAQQETQNVTGHHVTLTVHLLDGKTIDLSLPAMVEAHAVLQTVGEKLDIPEACLRYFCLFFEQDLDDGTVGIVRKLQDFECPYLLKETLAGCPRLVLRACYWDRDWDELLMAHESTLHLLYIQAVADLGRQWIVPTTEELKLLRNHTRRHSERDFVNLVRTTKFYGSLHFLQCVSDFPQANTNIQPCTVNKELVFRFPDATESLREMSFKVTRMRCWRITTAPVFKDNKQSQEIELELSFEYLISKDKLRWITIKSPQAILISLSLQEMVDELLEKKNGLSKPKMDKNVRPTWSYMKRDGTLRKLADAEEEYSSLSSSRESLTTPRKQSIHVIFGHLLGMHNNERRNTPARPTVENGAFQHIGDDDL